ncbi:M50 family metallopeptidase [Radiobacillus deserti]|uniref:Stage IV sporulation protein FB n=1 Tax=Radiobacillus deserti TaxID=2594883 RepID=A0A516KH66_9BACI|nr:M50 family metallopeptidase [Radiobacillus deserti]QDP40741.1 stage IV sporulation protein FB [Radiobacillus deserti]
MNVHKPLVSLPPIRIHPILWLFAITAIVTGTFMELTIIFSIVVIHELGHYLAAKSYHWRIRKISLWVFGGVMETEEHGSRPIEQELWVTVAGPLQHIWIYGVIWLMTYLGWWSSSIVEMALQYNTSILLFNLLPIWPLDGGKVLQLLSSTLKPYRTAQSITIVCSVIICLLVSLTFMFFDTLPLSTVMLVVFILLENRLEWKQRNYLLFRFLLKRYSEKPTLSKTSPILVQSYDSMFQILKQFRRNRHHHIFIKDGKESMWVDEDTCLDAYFAFKQHQAKAKDLVRLAE